MKEKVDDALYLLQYSIALIIVLAIVGGCVYSCYSDHQEKKELAIKAKQDSINAAKKEQHDLLVVKDESDRAGEFLYIDCYGVLHKRGLCRYIGNVETKYYQDEEGNDVEDEEVSHNGIKRILTRDITQSDIEYCCKHCISDELYKKLVRVADGEDVDEVMKSKYHEAFK